jgi:hypothetical protein
MRILGGILALFMGLILAAWKALVAIIVSALAAVRAGVETAQLSDAEIRQALDQVRQLGVPLPREIEQAITSWLRNHVLGMEGLPVGGTWLMLLLALAVLVLAIAVLIGRSRVVALLLVAAGAGGVFAGMTLTNDSLFSLGAYALAAFGGLLALVDSGPRRPAQGMPYRQPTPPPPPPGPRPPPPPLPRP